MALDQLEAAAPSDLPQLVTFLLQHSPPTDIKSVAKQLCGALPFEVVGDPRVKVRASGGARTAAHQGHVACMGAGTRRGLPPMPLHTPAPQAGAPGASLALSAGDNPEHAMLQAFKQAMHLNPQAADALLRQIRTLTGARVSGGGGGPSASLDHALRF